MPPKKTSLSKRTKSAESLQSQRENETSEEREDRLRTERSRASTSRAAETYEQHNERLQRERSRSSISRASETRSERETRLEGLRHHAVTARANETPSQRERRLQSQQSRTSISRATETLLGRVERLEGIRHHAETVRANETPSQREGRLQSQQSRTSTSRATETFLKRVERLERIRHHAEAVRANETPSQREGRLQSQQSHTTTSRATETPLQHEERLEGLRHHAVAVRSNETSLEREVRIQTQRNRTRSSRATETFLQREEGLEDIRRHATTVRATETPLEGEEHLEAQRIRTSSKRATERIEQLNLRREQNRNRMVSHRNAFHTYARIAFNYRTDIDYAEDPLVAVGGMNKVCQYCSALKYKNETPGMCCANGKVVLPELLPPPEPLQSLISGPKAHRKTNLDQYPTRPIGSPDDPLADPYDDPSYSFSYRTADQSRSEENDATGRVRGLYSFLDDEGVRHSVRYAAGAGTGFEVTNSVPDNPIDVGYTGPLYKAPPDTRGKMTVQRGPDGTYKLLAAGPDHRRAESRSPDGLVRGTYSFLDDKGIQRTVEYIAGAGIGYRVVKNRIGPGTHVNNQVLDFRLNDASFKLANDFGSGVGPGVELSGGGGAGTGGNGGGGRRGNKGRVGGAASGNRDYAQSAAGRVDSSEDNNNQIGSENAFESETNGRNAGSVLRNKGKENRMGIPKSGGRKGANGGGSNRGSSMSSKERDFMLERGYNRNDAKGRNPPSNGNTLNTNQRKPNRGPSSISNRNRPPSPVSTDAGPYHYDPPSPNSNNYDVSDDDFASALPPLVTANHKILEIDRDRDWVEHHRDSTIIKNVGKWYLGLPPGQSVRAHVQNIDILPLNGRRVPSPSEALRQDELADMAASLESESDPYRS